MKLYEEIHHLIQAFYLQRRWIRMEYDVGTLGISESQILFQSLSEPGVTSKRLAAVLQLEKSTISRIVSHLIEKDLLHPEPGEQDKREKRLFLTSSGEHMVRQLQESNNSILRSCLRLLAAAEQIELAHALRLLADGLNCSAASYVPGDHPVTTEIVRLGRGMGMTSNAFWGSDISSTQYHALAAINALDAPTLTELQSALPFDPSTISRTIVSLRERALVEHAASEKRRGVGFVITSFGAETLAALDRTAGDKIERALSAHPQTVAERLKDLLSRIEEGSSRAEGTVLSERIEVRELTKLSERQIARGMLFDSLVRSNQHFATPDELFSPSNRCFGLYVGTELVAACERVASGGIQNIAKLPQVEETLLNSFLASAEKLDSRH